MQCERVPGEAEVPTRPRFLHHSLDVHVDHDDLRGDVFRGRGAAGSGGDEAAAGKVVSCGGGHHPPARVVPAGTVGTTTRLDFTARPAVAQRPPGERLQGGALHST